MFRVLGFGFRVVGVQGSGAQCLGLGFETVRVQDLFFGASSLF